jgi:hypothetical protein
MKHNRPIVPRDFDGSLGSALAGGAGRTAGGFIAACLTRLESQPAGVEKQKSK